MRSAGRFVPRRFFIPVEVVVGLAVVGAIVAGFSEMLRKRTDVRRQFRPGPHVIGPEGDRVARRDDPCATWSTYAVAGKCLSKANAFSGQLIEIRSGGGHIAVTPESRTDVFATDPEDIRSIRGK